MSDKAGDLSSAVMHLIGQHGGLSGLLQKLQTGDLAEAAESWIGNGVNLSVTPAQLHNALGYYSVRSAADSSGLSTGDVLRRLAQHLPQAIDHMTPDGQMPTSSSGDLAMNFLRNR
jgi:uncharacterized protein YidB (DUF937 family)